MAFTRPSLTPLNHVEFRQYMFTRFFYIMSLQMVTTVVGYQLFDLTKDSLYIGFAGLAEFIPVFALALYAGHVIDRSDKRALLLKGVGSYSLCVASLIILTLPSVQSRFTMPSIILLFYIIIFFTGIIRSFVGPASSAIIAQLVPRDQLPFAASLSSTTWLAASIAGHGSSGFLMHWVGVNGTFCIIFGLILLAVFGLSRMKPKPIMHTKVGVKTWDSMKEGLQFVFRHKVLLGAISLDLFAVLFGGAKALIPEFSQVILQVGPIGFGWLNAAIDIGAVFMMVWLAFNPLRKRQGLILLYVIAGFGFCIIVFGLSDIYWISFTALLVAGMLDAVSMVVRSTVLQLTTPDEMRGRVSSVNSMFVNSSNELGQFESGFTARLFGGAQPAVLFGGIMTIIVVIIAWFRAPKLRKFEY